MSTKETFEIAFKKATGKDAKSFSEKPKEFAELLNKNAGLVVKFRDAVEEAEVDESKAVGLASLFPE